MKTPGLPLLAFVVTGTLAAQEPAAPSDMSSGALAKEEALAKEGPVKTSPRLKEEIRASLPPFTPPPPKALDQPHDSGIETDADIFALPKFTVKEKRPPGHDPDLWLTDRAIQQKAMASYKQSMTDLEWALNSWHIPLVSTPASVRARAAYENSKALAEIKRVHDLFGRISARDPNAAADLEKERVKMDQTEYWQSRPAGDGRAK